MTSSTLVRSPAIETYNDNVTGTVLLRIICSHETCLDCDHCIGYASTRGSLYEPSETTAVQCVIDGEIFAIDDNDKIAEYKCPLDYDFYNDNKILSFAEFRDKNILGFYDYVMNNGEMEDTIEIPKLDADIQTIRGYLS